MNMFQGNFDDVDLYLRAYGMILDYISVLEPSNFLGILSYFWPTY